MEQGQELVVIFEIGEDGVEVSEQLVADVAANKVDAAEQIRPRMYPLEDLKIFGQLVDEPVLDRGEEDWLL